MFISNVGAELFTVEFGCGPRAFVAHGGWAGSWEVWTETMTYLSKSWRAVAYDHRGTGATIASADTISIEAMVADLFAVLDTLRIEKCILAGESAGAAVVLRAALQQPERFEGLVVVDGLYHRVAPTGPDPFTRNLLADFQATIGAFVDLCIPESEPNSAAVRRWGRQILGRASTASAVRLIECMYGLDLRPEVARITLPTLVIHGDADVLVPLADAEWLAAHMPRGQLRVVQGAGHVPTVTRPREVAEAIDSFFSGTRA